VIWATIGLCLLISFLFSGIEAGILSVNRVRLKHRVKTRDRAALKLNRLLSNPQRLLITVLIVTNLMNISAILLATQEFVARVGGIGYLIAFVVFLPVYLFILEVLPKSLFRRFPYRALAAFAEPLRIADLLLAPVHAIAGGASRLICGEQPTEQQKLFVAREDFKYMTFESERSGALTKVERQMIHNVVDFRSVTAKDVMVPMERVQTIETKASILALLDRSRETGFDRWPVVGEGGQVTGLIDVFDIALDSRRHGVVEPFQRRILRLTATDAAYSILRKMRAARIGLAVVQDEAGVPQGIVTSEDLIKRLVSTAAQA
jgi:CBS domain containing-hemolysin-like protein